jgi:hypothetical protein
LNFVAQIVTASGAASVTMPANNGSPVFLISPPRPGSEVTLTLPPAAAATSRLIAFRMLGKQKVFIVAQAGEVIVGDKSPNAGIQLDAKDDWVQLVSDGVKYYVIGNR